MRHVAVAALVALAVAGCSSSGDQTPTASGAAGPAATPAATTQPVVTASGSGSPEDDEAAGVALPVSRIATAPGTTLTVLDAPDGEVAQVIRAEDVLTAPGATPLVFLVARQQGEWLELLLPVRPNGTTGWVRADAVVVTETAFRIEVAMEDFELTIYEGLDVVLETAIALGADGMPTPGGVYYIRELLQPPDPTGLYGPYAYGLSGYSPVLDEFAGGQAVIGIHGTNDPTSIGNAVSHGCIRVPNAVVRRMVEEVGLPLGTPVVMLEG
ncbi:L,D-transpeptidase [Demequina pelophila]|uniref:L,D-transpeptidase n=1 Tax=Demequina pelophila TaxID=1638984 RepID=UPI000784C528|nr:L,D-transpeptidase [Demequina pelophila]